MQKENKIVALEANGSKSYSPLEFATDNGHSNEAQDWTSRPRHKTKAKDIIKEEPFISKLSRRVIAQWPPNTIFYSKKCCLISREMSNLFVAICPDMLFKFGN